MHYIFHASDLNDNWRSIQGSVNVTDTLTPRADFNIRKSLDEDKVVTLNGSSSYDNIGVVDWIWEISGESSKIVYHEMITRHTFTDPGKTIVSLFNSQI